MKNPHVLLFNLEYRIPLFTFLTFIFNGASRWLSSCLRVNIYSLEEKFVENFEVFLLFSSFVKIIKKWKAREEISFKEFLVFSLPSRNRNGIESNNNDNVQTLGGKFFSSIFR